MMLKKQRHVKIIDFVNQNQFVRVEDIARCADVSEITVRRDINELDSLNLLKKVHGGAASMTAYDLKNDLELIQRTDLNADQKNLIADKVLDILPDDAVLYLDAGTTIAHIIPRLKEKNVTVYTHGLHHLDVLLQYNIPCYVIGGYVKPSTRAAVGSLSLQILTHLSFDYALIGFNALSEDFGYSTPDEMEAMIKRAVIQQSDHVYFVGDDSKFDHRSIVQFATIDEGTLISNSIPNISNIKVI